MAYCDVCGNFDDEHTDGEPEIKALEGYQPTLYYYWDGSFCEEDYDWRSVATFRMLSRGR